MNVLQSMNEIIVKEFFTMILRKKFNDETINILYIKDNSNLVKGTNYFSEFFKVKIVYTILSKIDKNLSIQIANIVIKSEPKSGMQLTMVREQGMFIRELTMLKETLPKIEKLVHKQLGPKLWYGSPECKILVMENLSERGFVMKDRQKGLPMEHCLLVIEQLAKLHAGSVALHEKEPKLIESFKTGGILSATCPESYMQLLEVSLLNMSKAIQGWTDQKYNAHIAVTKLNKLAKTIRDRCADVYKCEPNEFCVLNHGDCWINNIMFKENDDGKVNDVLMVDYQMSVYSSPAIDLHYFLNICPQTEIKYENDDFLLNSYLKTLTNTMISIGCTTKALTMKKLKAALYKRRIYAVFAGVILALRMMTDAKDNDFVEQLKGETKIDVFKNPDVVILAQKMIPIMYQRGYFDVQHINTTRPTNPSMSTILNNAFSRGVLEKIATKLLMASAAHKKQLINFECRNFFHQKVLYGCIYAVGAQIRCVMYKYGHVIGQQYTRGTRIIIVVSTTTPFTPRGLFRRYSMAVRRVNYC